MNFPRANTVAAINNHPHCREPLVQTERGIFKNGSGLERELWRFVLFAAMPAVVFLQKQDVRASTLGTGNTVRPAPSYHVFAAIYGIREEDDCVLKCGRFHAEILAGTVCFVKYIIT
jgi:hypothetical protein